MKAHAKKSEQHRLPEALHLDVAKQREMIQVSLLAQA